MAAGVLLLNLFVFGIVGWTLLRSHDQYLRIAAITAENLSHGLEENLTRFVDKVDLTLLAVIDEMNREKAAGGIDGKALTAFIARQDRRLPEALGLRVFDVEGRLLYAANEVFAPNGNVADSDAFRHWLETTDQGLYVSQPKVGEISGRPLIAMARRLTNGDGSFAGQINVSVGLEALSGVLRSVQSGQNGSMTLANRDARVIARAPNPGGAMGLVTHPQILPTLHALIVAGQTQASYHVRSAVDGIERTHFFRKVGGQDLYLLVNLADDDVLVGWWSEVEHMGALSGLFSLITVVGGVLVYRGWLQRRQVTETLARSQASLNMFRETLENSNDAILIIDLDTGKIVDFNMTACQQLGRGRAEMAGLSICDVDPEIPDLSSWMRVLDNIRQRPDGSSVVFERLHQRPDGEAFPVEISWRTTTVDGRRLGISIERNIAERKAFESRIAELSELNEQVVAESMLGLLAYQASGPCILANAAAARILGGTVEALLKQNFHTLASWSQAQRVMAAEVLTTGQSRTVVLHFTSTFGRYFWVEMAISKFVLRGEPHLLLALADVTEQKEAEQALLTKSAELEESNSALLQSNADLERFAYVASHDLQTPLRTIVSYTQLLERRYRGQLDDDAEEFITFIVGGAKRMSRLITDLLEYARVNSQGKALEVVAADKAVRFALDNLQDVISVTNAQITIAPLPEVMADESQLVSLFQNLIGNAIKYRAPERAPVISVSVAAGKAGQWEFAVADNGIGVEPQYFTKIFEIFQRLCSDAEVEGTGLGLAVCQRIVRRFGGEIWLESVPGQGSVFRFTLRAVATPIAYGARLIEP
jgi:PAS domain S-box-containing protein